MFRHRLANYFRIDASSLKARSVPPHPSPPPWGDGARLSSVRRAGASLKMVTWSRFSLSPMERAGVREKELVQVRKTETAFGNCSGHSSKHTRKNQFQQSNNLQLQGRSSGLALFGSCHCSGELDLDFLGPCRNFGVDKLIFPGPAHGDLPGFDWEDLNRSVLGPVARTGLNFPNGSSAIRDTNDRAYGIGVFFGADETDSQPRIC
jgi:hypothetical protein